MGEWGGESRLGMVQVSATREGRMPIFQLCPVHTEPDWWVSSEKIAIKPRQRTCKRTFKVKLTLHGVVTSLQNGQTWEKSPDIQVWTFLIPLSQLKSRWRIVVIPVRSKMLSMKAWLSGQSLGPGRLVLPRLAGLSTLLSSSETRPSLLLHKVKMKIIWELSHLYHESELLETKHWLWLEMLSCQLITTNLKHSWKSLSLKDQISLLLLYKNLSSISFVPSRC